LFLLIFESIGTSELILIGVVALIFLGPRKMPEYARKIGKLMNEFRSTTNDFKATWEREVNFDEETRAFRDDDPRPAPVPHFGAALAIETPLPLSPKLTAADPSAFSADVVPPAVETKQISPYTASDDDINDRKNWL
jgi:sec-independent protein translocase protein TatA